MITTPVMETYWRFAAERQEVFFRRLHDQQGPWTNDPIISKYKFTNVYRILDRVSQYLVREVQYREDRSQEPSEIFFRTILFKVFNKIETWESLERELGHISWRATKISDIEKRLDYLFSRGKKIYSAAYIMPSPNFGNARKHANHLALLEQMMSDRLPDRLAQAPNLAAVFERLASYPGIGRFLAFQYAIDLNYSAMLNFDEAELVVAGPGAIDGISKCFTDTGGKTPEEVIFEVTSMQDDAFKELGLRFRRIGNRPLQPIDCQNIFCEISKYARVAHPQVRGVAGRTRIKQEYRSNNSPFPSLFFPPRWEVAVQQYRKELVGRQQYSFAV